LKPRRLWIAAVWLAGAIVPVALMAVFLFGCCILPFHRYVHHVMPLCGGIVKLLASEPVEKTPSTAPRAPEGAKQAPVVLSREIPTAIRLASFASTSPALPSPREELRHSAARCDDDVGLHLLHSTFLI
jgi:hypothetical protein